MSGRQCTRCCRFFTPREPDAIARELWQVVGQEVERTALKTPDGKPRRGAAIGPIEMRVRELAGEVAGRCPRCCVEVLKAKPDSEVQYQWLLQRKKSLGL